MFSSGNRWVRKERAAITDKAPERRAYEVEAAARGLRHQNHAWRERRNIHVHTNHTNHCNPFVLAAADPNALKERCEAGGLPHERGRRLHLER